MGDPVFQELAAVIGMEEVRHLVSMNINIVQLHHMLKNLKADGVMLVDEGGKQSIDNVKRSTDAQAVLFKHFQPGVGVDFTMRSGEVITLVPKRCKLTIITPTNGRIDIDVPTETTVHEVVNMCWENMANDEKAIPRSDYQLKHARAKRILPKQSKLACIGYLKDGDWLHIKVCVVSLRVC